MVDVADRADVSAVVSHAAVPVGVSARKQGEHVDRLQLQHTDAAKRQTRRAEQPDHPLFDRRKLRNEQERQAVDRDRQKPLPAGGAEPGIGAERGEQRRHQRKEQIQNGKHLRQTGVCEQLPESFESALLCRQPIPDQPEDDRAVSAADHKERIPLYRRDRFIAAAAEAKQKEGQQDGDEYGGDLCIMVCFRFHIITQSKRDLSVHFITMPDAAQYRHARRGFRRLIPASRQAPSTRSARWRSPWKAR